MPIAHLRPDPFNGRLYWVESGQRLYSQPMRDECWNRAPILLVQRPRLGPFEVLFDQWQLLVPDLEANQLLQVDVMNETSK